MECCYACLNLIFNVVSCFFLLANLGSIHKCGIDCLFANNILVSFITKKEGVFFF